MSETLSVRLERRFRQELIETAIETAGSKYALAMALGYLSKGSGKTINEWLEGRANIPYSKLEKLCEIARIPLSEALNHTTQKQH